MEGYCVLRYEATVRNCFTQGADSVLLYYRSICTGTKDATVVIWYPVRASPMTSKSQFDVHNPQFDLIWHVTDHHSKIVVSSGRVAFLHIHRYRYHNFQSTTSLF